jgi:hypothetical protein
MERRPYRLVHVLLLFLLAGSAGAAEVRIHHAEEFALPAKALPTSASLSKPESRSKTPVAFAAFGKTFALELDDNSALLARLPVERRTAIAGLAQLYAGRLQDQPNSWMRLTRVGDDLYGLIYDGREFYSIAPGRTLEPVLDAGIAPPGAAQTNLIYRARDMDVDLGANFCSAVRKGGRTTRMTGAQAFDAVLGEIASTAITADGLPTREVEVGLLGDLEFSRRQGSTSEATLAARFNIVDGIFSEQVGLRITIGYLKVYTGYRNPFTTNDSEDLLTELAEYREATSALQAFGLTHLVTGRSLIGDTIGIGFVEGVCDPYYGSSLSEDMGFDVTLSALIAAHELGHNFGARHDTEAGSPCVTTPDGYLMAPRINYSGTFSACSVETMEPIIESAACIFPARVRDAEIRPILVPPDTTVRTQIPLLIPVRSIGNAWVDNVRVAVRFLDFRAPLSITDATVTGGACTIASLRVDCTLGSMPPGTVRKIRVVVRGEQVDKGIVYAQLSARNDMRERNDRKGADINLAPRVDVSLTSDEEFQDALVAEWLTKTFTVSVTGSVPGENVVFRSDFGGALIQSATADGANCFIKAMGPVCNLGTVPAGQSRNVTVTYAEESAGGFEYRTWVTALEDNVPNNESFYFTASFSPRHALELYQGLAPQSTVGEPVTMSAWVAVYGPQPLEDTTVRLDFDPSLPVLSVSADAGQCRAIPNSAAWACDLPVIDEAHGSSIEFVTQPAEPGSYAIRVTASSPNNDNPADPTIEMTLLARPRFDMRAYAGEAYLYDHRDGSFYVHAYSNSLNDETNVRLNVTLPEAIVINSATPKSGTCTLTANTASCSLGRIRGPLGAGWVELKVRSNDVGEYKGTVTVLAANDSDATNNKATLSVSVLENIDASVNLPANRTVVEGETFTVPVRIRIASQGISEATLEIDTSRRLVEIKSVQTTQGSCQAFFGTSARCTIGALPANSVTTLYVRALAKQQGSDDLRFRLSTPGDVEYSNNYGSTSLTIEAPPPP